MKNKYSTEEIHLMDNYALAYATSNQPVDKLYFLAQKAINTRREFHKEIDYERI